MEESIKKAIEEYQCPGCVCGMDIRCYKPCEDGEGVQCDKHACGTLMTGAGLFFLGMPKGFNRTGQLEHEQKVLIFEKAKDYLGFNMWNVPVWKHLDGCNTIVRGLSPRINYPFIHVYLENCMDKIDCLEITKDDIDSMD